MENCRLLKFNCIGSRDRGYLVPIEENKNIPFEIKRVYYTFGVPTDVERGFHAHKDLEQVLICVNGSFKVKCFDGKNKEVYELNSKDEGLYIGNLVWREICDYSENSVLLSLASKYYSEEDYIRDYSEFIKKVEEIKGELDLNENNNI